MGNFQARRAGMSSRVFISIAVIILTCTTFLYPEVRYVSPSGENIPPFTSWQTAAHRIQDCIDISNDDDTIFVGSGLYKDTVRMSKRVNLIGSGWDNTIIDGTALSTVTIDVMGIDNSGLSIEIENLLIKGPGIGSGACIVSEKKLNVKNCKLYNGKTGISFLMGGDAENVFFRGFSLYGINCGDIYLTHHTYNNNVILTEMQYGHGIDVSVAGDFDIINNILIDTYYNPAEAGIYMDWVGKIKVFNNLISGYLFTFYLGSTLDSDTAFFFNNIFANNGGGYGHPASLYFNSHNNAIVRNNIFYNNAVGIRGDQYNQTDYNAYWLNNRDLYGITGGDHDIKGRNPMFVNDGVDTNLTFDFHLQKYSPCIDSGDPGILDKDGTRSDIGLYGGPYGESYTYQDLAPRTPVNFTASVDSQRILLKWNKNSETDTSYYSVYMAHTEGFPIDSTKLISKQTDTVFTYPSMKKEHYYFKVTATDMQGNQSAPTEEIHINLVAVDDKYPLEITDYRLYQNYPNPFNPTTNIPYRLKEKGYVKLMLYNIMGELVRVLVNKEEESGYHEVKLDAKGLPSGIYLIHIEVTGKGSLPVFTDMKKTILLK